EAGAAGHVLGINQAAAAVFLRVAVEQFIPCARLWHAQAIALTRYGSEVADENQGILWLLAFAHERDDAVVRVVGINPRKTLWMVVQLAQRRFAVIEGVEVAYKLLELRVARVAGRSQQMPVDALFEVPLAPLTDLAAHEEQFLPWMPPHIAKEGAQIGEVLPEIARHLVKQRAFDVHDFIM